MRALYSALPIKCVKFFLLRNRIEAVRRGYVMWHYLKLKKAIVEEAAKIEANHGPIAASNYCMKNATSFNLLYHKVYGVWPKK